MPTALNAGYFGGKKTVIRHGASSATIMRCRKVSIVPKYQKFDTSDGESPVGQYIHGLFDLDVNIEGAYYVTSNPYAFLAVNLDSPFLTEVKIYLSGTGNNQFWYIPNLFVEQMPLVTGARDVPTWNIQGSGMGSITMPADTTG